MLLLFRTFTSILKSFILRNVWPSICLLFALVSCEPKPADTDLLKNMIVETDVDTSVDFTTYSTYKLPIDTIGYFSNTIHYASDTLLVYSSSNPTSNLLVHDVVSEIQAKMNASGYVLKSPKENPDLWVEVYISENVTSSSDKATLFIRIIDIKKGSLLWTAYIGDLVSTTDNTTATVIKAIDQAFTQSPYIVKK